MLLPAYGGLLDPRLGSWLALYLQHPGQAQAQSRSSEVSTDPINMNKNSIYGKKRKPTGFNIYWGGGIRLGIRFELINHSTKRSRWGEERLSWTRDLSQKKRRKTSARPHHTLGEACVCPSTETPSPPVGILEGSSHILKYTPLLRI